MNRLGNTSWLNNRQINHRVAVQQLPAAAFPDLTQPLVKAVRNAFAFIPSWIILAMIILSATAICSTVILRSRAELTAAASQYTRIASDIEMLRHRNVALGFEVRRMTTEPAMIESAARERLGMVRPTDIVVPISSQPSTNLATLSFVR